MAISIDLNVKCPFYNKWNKKKTPIFFSREIFTLYLCPQFTKVSSSPGGVSFDPCDSLSHENKMKVTSYRTSSAIMLM